jgi:hypothetical protein
MAVYRVPVQITWTGSGSPGVNVWSVRTVNEVVQNPDLDLNEAVTALDAFYGKLTAYYPPGMKTTIGPDILERGSLTDFSQTAKVRSSTASVGSLNLPPANQVVVGWKTTLRARRGMGRTFIGPLLNSAQESDGTLSSTFLAALDAAVAALVNDSKSTTNGWAIGVWGLQNKGQYDANGQLIPGQARIHRDIVSYKIRDQFAVLRSRRD